MLKLNRKFLKSSPLLNKIQKRAMVIIALETIDTVEGLFNTFKLALPLQKTTVDVRCRLFTSIFVDGKSVYEATKNVGQSSAARVYVKFITGLGEKLYWYVDRRNIIQKYINKLEPEYMIVSGLISDFLEDRISFDDLAKKLRIIFANLKPLVLKDILPPYLMIVGGDIESYIDNTDAHELIKILEYIRMNNGLKGIIDTIEGPDASNGTSTLPSQEANAHA